MAPQIPTDTFDITALNDLVHQARALLVQAADELIVPRFRNLGDADVSCKTSPSDLVTIADVETEAWLTPRLAKLLPGSKVVGEEAVSESPRLLNALDDPAPVWVVDPVDGTGNFANGSETFVTMLALVIGGTPVLGIIWRPIARQALWAVRGGGAWIQADDDAPSRLTAWISGAHLKAVDQLVGAVHFRRLKVTDLAQVRRNAKQFAKAGNWGCAGEEYARVAQGRLDFAVFGSLNPWDHCPGLVIVREAGGADMLASACPYDTLTRMGRLVVGTDADVVATVSSALFEGSDTNA